jgi:chemotaxis regulatin CheY-phosphate phosphatase CheZ
MELPTQPVTLTVEQIAELHQQLANMRHDVNNKLSLILAAVDVTQYKPQMIDRMMATVAEQPQKIIEMVAAFSAEFEKTFGIKR